MDTKRTGRVGSRKPARGPTVVLCSRGRSFPERMLVVRDWAGRHGIKNIILLHCPETKYSIEYVDTVRAQAQALFNEINIVRKAEGLSQFSFEFIAKQGLLQDGIRELIRDNEISIIFVGKRMLDFRLEDVKQLTVPFVFLD